MIKLHEWVKRLGQQHWYTGGSMRTLCGMPMLGNNYAKERHEGKKTPCEECKAKAVSLLEETVNGG